jgi:hypothetical protein
MSIMRSEGAGLLDVIQELDLASARDALGTLFQYMGLDAASQGTATLIVGVVLVLVVIGYITGPKSTATTNTTVTPTAPTPPTPPPDGKA